MITENYIRCLKTKNREAYKVALRQTLIYYLYREKIPCTIISSIMGCTRRYVYTAIYGARDRMEVGDALTMQANEELKKHQIRIVPVTADGGVLTMFVGYRMFIDNEIF